MNRNKDLKIDVLIIGAGPSGCVAAAYLHNHGIEIAVVEKSVFPRFVIGESLLPRCMDHFEEVGLLDSLKAQQYEVKRGARFIKKDVVCHFDFSDKYTQGWDWTWQVPRAHFDKTLTDTLQAKGVDIHFNTEVVDVVFAEDGSSTTTVLDEKGTTRTIHSTFIIDASGFGRVLPRMLDLDAPSSLPKHSSIFTHVKEPERPEGTEGTLITFDVVTDDTWLWVIPFSNGITSIGFVGPTDVIMATSESASERLRSLLKMSNHYHDRFEALDFLFEPKVIQNYSKSVKQLYGNGYALTGNSAEFLDPVFSSGVTFATESGLLAAKLITKELQGITVDWEKEYSGYIKEGITVFGTYVAEWYTGNLQKIFFQSNSNPEIKRQICAVLAGYVWDQSNPFVKNHHRLVKTVAHVIDLEQAANKDIT